MSTSNNAKASRPYTPLENKKFLDALSNQKSVIENKPSDASTLKQKSDAWVKVATEYNTSHSIIRERSVAQLKKLWANLKQGQRNALTAEKQSHLATGGGPAQSPVVIDPDIAAIAPHLMVTIPVEHTSNILTKENSCVEQPATKRTEIHCIEIDRSNTEFQPSVSEATLDMPASIGAISEEDQPTPSTSREAQSSTSTAVPDTPRRNTKQARFHSDGPAAKKARFSNCGSIHSNSTHHADEEKELRVERVRRLIAYDEEMAAIRRTQEVELGELKKQHMERIHSLELRAAQAKCALAELELKVVKN